MTYPMKIIRYSTYSLCSLLADGLAGHTDASALNYDCLEFFAAHLKRTNPQSLVPHLLSQTVCWITNLAATTAVIDLLTQT